MNIFRYATELSLPWPRFIFYGLCTYFLLVCVQRILVRNVTYFSVFFRHIPFSFPPLPDTQQTVYLLKSLVFVITTHNFSCSKLPWWLKGYFSCLSTTRPVYFESFFGMISTISRLESSVSVNRTRKLDSIVTGGWQVVCEVCC